jgi:aminopeptidase N
MKWQGRLPELTERAGFEGSFHMVSQWFPKIGVFTGQGWKCHVYCASCEFFADFGNYDVELTVPRKYVVGASGTLVRSEIRGEERIDTYHAEDIHDFAWAASPDFLERRELMDERPGHPGVMVRLLYQPDHSWFTEEQLRLLRLTLRDYGDWFGAYPYSTLTAIDVPDDATAAAMEYPTLVAILSPASVLAPERSYARYVTIHELGHNWFYGLVASNEAEEPWLDEGVNPTRRLPTASPQLFCARLRGRMGKTSCSLPWVFTLSAIVFAIPPPTDLSLRCGKRSHRRWRRSFLRLWKGARGITRSRPLRVAGKKKASHIGAL